MHNEKSNFLLAKESKLQQILADIFTCSSFELNNKKIFVNVLYVDLSPDLKHAKVCIDQFGLDNKIDAQNLVKELNKNFVKQTRNLIAQKMRIKYIPEIIFFLDNSKEKIDKINSLIEKEDKFFKEKK